MTAPDRATWTVAEDHRGCPTIWTDYDHAVAHRDGDRIHIDPAFAEQVWSLLRNGLAPDEATIERLAEASHAAVCGCRDGAQPGYPMVQGRCPACGAASLFLGSGGYVTCASLSCADPTLATDVLAKMPEPGVAS